MLLGGREGENIVARRKGCDDRPSTRCRHKPLYKYTVRAQGPMDYLVPECRSEFPGSGYLSAIATSLSVARRDASPRT